jgi:nucleotidyltransferase substrate binding protein (TIGR01987 family)
MEKLFFTKNWVYDMSSFGENRWLQRFQNYQRALTHLDQAIKSTEDKEIDEFSDLEIQGTIKCFEMVFDLSWKTLQDYLGEQGYGMKGPKPILDQSFKDDLITNGDEWAKMLDSRNKAAHAYDRDLATEVLEKIRKSYYPLFDDLDKVLARIKNNG